MLPKRLMHFIRGRAKSIGSPLKIPGKVMQNVFVGKTRQGAECGIERDVREMILFRNCLLYTSDAADD